MSRRDFSDCMIGEGSKVDGTIDAPGMVRIDGEFSGDIISASSVIISLGSSWSQAYSPVAQLSKGECAMQRLP